MLGAKARARRPRMCAHQSVECTFVARERAHDELLNVTGHKIMRSPCVISSFFVLLQI